MMTRTTAPARGAALVAALLVLATGCGDVAGLRGAAGPATASRSPSADRATGDWLLRFTTAGGQDGEDEGSFYVRYDPSTGAATTRTLPAPQAPDAGQADQVLLVNADHTLAVQDTAVPAAQARTGRLVLYSLTGGTTQTLDIRAATGDPRLRALAWAFDPSDAHLLRVVDSARDVWKVDLAAGSASREGRLEKRSGWIFGNGFDPATGEPYIESIDSDQTDPAGNGDSDVRPVTRQGGTVIAYDGGKPAGLPSPPCDLATVFRFDDGDGWVFCADTPSITAYRLRAGSGGTWVRVGKPSPRVLPAEVAAFDLALPPVG